MTDFKVKSGVDSFRFKSCRYKPGDIISVSDKETISQLRANHIVEELKEKPQPKITAPAKPAEKKK